MGKLCVWETEGLKKRMKGSINKEHRRGEGVAGR